MIRVRIPVLIMPFQQGTYGLNLPHGLISLRQPCSAGIVSLPCLSMLFLRISNRRFVSRNIACRTHIGTLESERSVLAIGAPHCDEMYAAALRATLDTTSQNRICAQKLRSRFVICIFDQRVAGGASADLPGYT